MELLSKILDFVLHLDKHLSVIIQSFGLWTYLILFFVIFLETGFVVTPFLPGDSLLFAAGTFAAAKVLHVVWLFVILSAAAVLGDTANYWIGYFVGPKVFRQERSRFFKKEYLERTHRFYEKYGPETIIIARFVPIVRTFAPFVAGIGIMYYRKFMLFSALGSLAWITSLAVAGYLFGNIPLVKNNLTLIIAGIIVISLLPAISEFIRHRKSRQSA